MTTDARRLIGAAALALAGWLALLALLMGLGAPAPAALALWPREGFVARLPEGAAVVAAGPLGVTVAGGAAGALYAAGARLVLPAGLAGCLGG